MRFTAAVVIVLFSTSKVTYTVPVYTRIFPRQPVAAGSYSDALMVTITWSVSG
jgi:spore coat protein U-like protein